MTHPVHRRTRQRGPQARDPQHRRRGAEDRRRYPRAGRRQRRGRRRGRPRRRFAGVAKVLLADARAPRCAGGRERRRAALPLIAPAATPTCSRRRPASARTSRRGSPRCSTSRRFPRSSPSISPDTFVRPIYAGNALATVQSKDAIKVITVRATAFDAVAGERRQRGRRNRRGGARHRPRRGSPGRRSHKSERPELTSARIIVSGGRAWAAPRTSSCSSRWPTS